MQIGPLISFMMEQLDKAGCPLSPDHFRCTPCDLSKSGGFAPEFGVMSQFHSLTSPLTNLVLIRLSSVKTVSYQNNTWKTQ